MTQAARNHAIDPQDAGCQARFLIHARDGKYPTLPDTIPADTGTTVVPSGVRTPRINAIMKRWIQSRRHELPDRAPIRNQTHPLPALHQYEQHHNEHRPHRGIANTRPLQPLPEPITSPDTVMHLNTRRRDRLGGITHEYQHAA